MANISMDPRPTSYLRQNIVFSYPEMIRVSFSLFLCLSVFCYFTLLLIFIKIVLLLLLFYLFIFMKMFFFFMFRDVPVCSGMFRHVPECSMFRILSTAGVKIDASIVLDVKFDQRYKSIQPYLSQIPKISLVARTVRLVMKTW